ncbi:MAG: alkaline phosphatase family protein [Microthrixaceae bacterium]
MDASVRVLWVVIDALGSDKVVPELMPELCRLGASGALGQGRGVLPALTYPNHATFVTGVEPPDHGIYANDLFSDGEWTCAGDVGPSRPTIFDATTALGVESVGVFGDHNLVGVCGAHTATVHWPPGGSPVSGIESGPTGYASDRATVQAARDSSLADFAFAMVQLDEHDAVSHVHGPDSPQASLQATASDSALGEILDSYGRCWDDTIVVVLSDHAQETVHRASTGDIDNVIATAAERLGHGGDRSPHWRADGTAVVLGPGSPAWAHEAVSSMPEIETLEVFGDGSAVGWGSDGVVLGLDWGQRGDHGSMRCIDQVAVVGGGHPLVADLAAIVQRGTNPAASWLARTLALFE